MPHGSGAAERVRDYFDGALVAARSSSPGRRSHSTNSTRQAGASRCKPTTRLGCASRSHAATTSWRVRSIRSLGSSLRARRGSCTDSCSGRTDGRDRLNTGPEALFDQNLRLRYTVQQNRCVIRLTHFADNPPRDVVLMRPASGRGSRHQRKQTRTWEERDRTRPLDNESGVLAIKCAYGQSSHRQLSRRILGSRRKRLRGRAHRPRIQVPGAHLHRQRTRQRLNRRNPHLQEHRNRKDAQRLWRSRVRYRHPSAPSAPRLLSRRP
jgi:hypothetical protein